MQNSYSSKVKIGNWSEERVLHELKIKDYLHAKSQQRLLQQQNQHIHTSLQPSLQTASLTYSQDNRVRFGDSVMIYNVHTGGVLSVDVTDKSSPNSFPVTTSSLTKAPVARNVFILEPTNKKSRHGDVIKYGQHFRIRLNPLLSSMNSYYLHSQPVSLQCSSRLSRKQRVVFQQTPVNAEPSFDTVWKAAHKHITTRFETEGEPVDANAEITLIHQQTQQSLSSDSSLVVGNDFGREFEVCGFTQVDIKKTHVLHSEFQGNTTADISARSEGVQNHWAFLTNATKAAAAATEIKKQPNEAKSPVQCNDSRATIQPSQSDQLAVSKPSPSCQPTSTVLSHSRSNSPLQYINSLPSVESVEMALKPSEEHKTSEAQVHSAAMDALDRIRDTIINAGPFAFAALVKQVSAHDKHHSGSVTVESLKQAFAAAGLELSANELQHIVSTCKGSFGTVLWRQLFAHIRQGSMPASRLALVERVWNQVLKGRDNVSVESIRAAYTEDTNELLQQFNLVDGRVSKIDFVEFYEVIAVYVEDDEQFVDVLSKAWQLQ